MAKKNGRKEIEAPEGFDVNVGRERGSGWVTKEEGNKVRGRLLGRYSFKAKATGKTRFYYQVELHEPCNAQVIVEEGDEEITENTELSAGDIVNVDESKALEDLQKLVDKIDRGAQYDVWFVYKAKEEIGGGQTFWPVHGPKAKQVKAPTSKESDKIPF